MIAGRVSIRPCGPVACWISNIFPHIHFPIHLCAQIPGYACAKTESNLQGRPNGCHAGCCLAGMFCAPCALCWQRHELATHQHIDDNKCNDFCCAVLCPGPVAVQNYVEAEVVVAQGGPFETGIMRH